MKKYLIIGNAQSTHIVKWVKELVKYFDLYIISSTTTHEDIRKIIKDSNIFDLKIPVKEEGGNVSLLKKFFIVKSIIKKINPHFVNPHYITSHGFLAAIIKRLTGLKFKLIQSAWGSDILVTPFKNTLYFNITKFCLNAADLATSDSEYMTNIIKKMSKVEVSTFIFGIDKLPDIDIAIKDENLFYSNRMLSSNYNIDEVINFFKKIADENPKAKLLISHDGSKRSELEDLVKRLKLEDKVSFKGFVSLEDQKLFYKKSAIYISIPTSDSTSVSLIEAMAYGCIPVVSNIPANREWIDDGNNGIFYKPGIGYEDIKKILAKKRFVFDKNRKIVSERAIFPKSFKEYVETIKII